MKKVYNLRASTLWLVYSILTSSEASDLDLHCFQMRVLSAYYLPVMPNMIHVLEKALDGFFKIIS